METSLDYFVTSISETLDIPQEDVLRQGLYSLLEKQLREVKAEIFAITGRYSVFSVSEMDAQYQAGTLDEASSWQDYQRLDHLEYERDHLQKLIEELS
jgi:hypothetical protein